MCISLTTARGRKQEENAFHSCVIGLCICWLCTCLLFPVSMWVYALLYTFSLCVDVAHQGVYHSPDCQMSLVDWTLCLKRTKMYSWVVAQEAQFTACCLSLTKERQIWWIHGPIAEYDGLCWSLGARQNIVGGVHKLLNLSERVTLLSSTQGKVCKWHSRSKKAKIRRKHEWSMANICLKRSFWKKEAAREINLIYLCDV